MNTKADLSFKTTFDKEAELYNEARPGYPSELYDKLIEITHLNENAELLEIGPGPGKSTKPLAERGYKITAIELGPQLAELARKNLHSYSNVSILNSSFEDIDLPRNSYDLIYSASAFHWIKPEFRYTKTHSLLKPGGYLAIIWGRGGVTTENGNNFQEEVREITRKFITGDDLPKPMLLTELHPPEDFDKDLYDLVHFQTFPKKIEFKTDEFIKLLGTYSKCIAMEKDVRDECMREVRKLIDEKFDGVVERTFANALTIFKAK